MSCTLALCLIGALAVDGDTLRHEGHRLRLWGINAAERGTPGADYATATLRALIAGQVLACDVIDPADRYGRPDALDLHVYRPLVGCLRPDGPQQLRAGVDPAGMPRHGLQNVPLVRRRQEPFAIVAEAHSAGVDDHAAKPHAIPREGVSPPLTRNNLPSTFGCVLSPL